MGRLTKRYKNGVWKNLEDNPTVSYKQICEKLAHYEDLEEQGRLIELPCAVGDTIYEVHDGEIRTNRLGSKWRITRYLEEGFLGELVFTTKEEAEAKLKELEGVKE